MTTSVTRLLESKVAQLFPMVAKQLEATSVFHIKSDTFQNSPNALAMNQSFKFRMSIFRSYSLNLVTKNIPQLQRKAFQKIAQSGHTESSSSLTMTVMRRAETGDYYQIKVDTKTTSASNRRSQLGTETVFAHFPPRI